MKTTNPVLSRFGRTAVRERGAGYAAGAGYQQPAYGQGYPPAGYPEPSGYPNGAFPTSPVSTRTMTIDDVVVKTATLLGLLAASAAAAWVLIPDALLGAAWIGAAVVGLVLGLIISFSRMANPALVVAYSVVEGVFVGMVSKFFTSVAGYDGIVLQAVVATFGVFFAMVLLYKARVVRATPRFTRILIAVMGGLFAAMLINFVLALFGVDTGLRSGGPVAVGFSLICIVVAALSFVLNFAEIEEGVRAGLPERYSWMAAFGILVGLVWLYLEVLRLLSYFQGDD
ncbi:Bax inhibitor-1/YccA family protein [Plantactinospora siamensis]|uniref:Bax inhibitor-1/YccA family protein n=1 Tax=Plantactinospora siamensis TaxID=555372 RepID=A0ABV6NQV8_9ACTN